MLFILIFICICAHIYIKGGFILIQSKRKWLVLATVSLAVFMAMLDITIVNVALPEIQQAFSANFSNLQWVLNAYTLVYAAMLLPVSKLGDIIGRKKYFY